MGKHKTKRKCRKNTVKKGGRDPPDIGLLKSELARQKEETARNIQYLTNENERLDSDSARLEIEKRDLDMRNLVLVNELEASSTGRELYLAQINTLRRENAELLNAHEFLNEENEFLNEENDNLLDELQELKKKEIED